GLAPPSEIAQLLLRVAGVLRQPGAEVKAPLAPDQLGGAEHREMLQAAVDRPREPLERQRQHAIADQQRAVVRDRLGRLGGAAVHPSGRRVGQAPDGVEAPGLRGLQTGHHVLLSWDRVAASIAAATRTVSSTKPPRLATLSAVE